ncbi:MAG: hypothetical protein HKN91_16770 [Acidimicrobiia bacterium]|nr:hypothetical protein [Acidimicrobiia bacterium]
MPVLATWAPEDGVLGAVAPLALATAQPTCLVVDLDADGPAYPSERSLRDLVSGGPRAVEIRPESPGLAVLANGGVSFEEAREIVELLIQNWPAVVLRLGGPPGDVPAPFVPVRLLVPGRLFPPQGRGVYQRVVGRRMPVPAGGVSLPAAPRKTVDALLTFKQPAPSRWLRAWRRVWSAEW